jgi:hypothetical protein
MSLYRDYQLIGGNEEWKTAYEEEDLSSKRPTFVTVLACDTQITKEIDKERVEKAKYAGPMYFDLDSEDIEDSIAAAKLLYSKLESKGLQESDMQIFLSGKKGLHFVIPASVFRKEKSHLPLVRLPMAYKELAYEFALDTMDFRVYSARRGRMFRTCYNQRENGKWKVQINKTELLSLTAETYDAICSAPRLEVQPSPVFRPELGILFEKVYSQVVAEKRAKPRKKLDPKELARHKPTAEKVMSGEGVLSEAGFNQIAMQLSVYAKEAGLAEDEFISKCQGLIENYRGDGARYNSSRKRETELRRMFGYVDEAGTYDYNPAAITKLLDKEVKEELAKDNPERDLTQNGGVFEDVEAQKWYVQGPQDEVPRHIMNGIITDLVAVKTLQGDGDFLYIAGNFKFNGKESRIIIGKDEAAANVTLHKVLSAKGGLFAGSDTQARYIFDIMLTRSITEGKVSYNTGSEGVDLLEIPLDPAKPFEKTSFIVYTDVKGVRIPPYMREHKLTIEYAADPGPEPSYNSDLADAKPFDEWSAAEGNVQALEEMLDGLLSCQEPSSLSRLIGWITASFYTSLFRKAYTKFPLLHVVGPAGTGKTEMLEGLIRMHFCTRDAAGITAGSSLFAVQTMMSSSSSIPLIVDEYKPHTMATVAVEALRGTFRSNYNGQSVAKGGGNSRNSSYRGLNLIKLAAPTVFISEAMETEPAILHRCVLVTLKRIQGRAANRTRPFWLKFKRYQKTLSQIGAHIASSIVSSYSLDQLKAEFDPIHTAALETYLYNISDEDLDGTGKQAVPINERTIYNHAVAEFGLRKFFETATLLLPHKEEWLKEKYTELSAVIYGEVDKVADNSMAEYLRVLTAMSDMSKFEAGISYKLVYGIEYEVANQGGLEVISIIPRHAYNKYRMYCKATGSIPLFGNDASFAQSLKDCPIYAGVGNRTKGLALPTFQLDYGAMQRLGVDPFATR